MTQKNRTISKILLFAALFCIIDLVTIYYFKYESCIQKQEFTSSLLRTNYSWDNFTNDMANKAVNDLYLEKLKVTENDTPIYDTEFISTPLTLLIFPLEGTVNLESRRSIEYTLQTSNILDAFFIQSGISVFLIAFIAYLAYVMTNKESYQQIIEIKNAILNKRYEELPFSDLSNQLTKNEEELKNNLEEAVKKIEYLENSASIDPLTGLYNRNIFRQTFEEMLNKKTPFTNILGLVRATEIQQINVDRGFQMGDKYIQDVAELVKNAIKRFPGSNAYRISGSDIAILMPNATEENIQNIIRELKIQVDQYQNVNSLTSVCYSGYTVFKSKETSELVIARADLALALAQTGAINGSAIQIEDVEGYLQGEIHWRQTVQDIINRHAVTLYYQPIKSMNISIQPYVEIFARFTSKEGEMLSTETILAAAQRHDLLIRLEELIIDNIISRYYTVAQNTPNVSFGINLSANALISTSFLLWLERTLLRHSDVAKHLVFEIDETILESNLSGAERLFSIINRSGSHTSISHFGKGIESFRLYRALRPNYIKLDPNLCQSFEKDLATQQFIRMIIEVSHRLGCVVVAEGVETIPQRQQLENLYIDAIQGYLISKPTELVDSIDLSFKSQQAL